MMEWVFRDIEVGMYFKYKDNVYRKTRIWYGQSSNGLGEINATRHNEYSEDKSNNIFHCFKGDVQVKLFVKLNTFRLN